MAQVLSQTPSRWGVSLVSEDRTCEEIRQKYRVVDAESGTCFVVEIVRSPNKALTVAEFRAAVADFISETERLSRLPRLLW